MADSTAVPAVPLDPFAADHHAEQRRLRDAGPIVRVELPGGVLAWVVTDYTVLADLVADARMSKNWRNWNAIQDGTIPDDWPLIGMIKVTNMVTSDAAEHARLRKPVTKVFTRGRVERLRPRINEIVAALLDELPSHTGNDGSVDLRAHYAYPVPMQVICELVGVPHEWRADLRALVDSIFRTDTTSDEVLTTQHDRQVLLTHLVQLRRHEPGEDLISALIALQAQDEAALTTEELIDTLWLLLTAGHETTLSLITNGVRALLTHPDQLAIAMAGDADTWAGVVEEVLRWDAPIGNFPARYPVEDITIAGVAIPKGDAILAAYSGVGRDPSQYGPDADRFDITRSPQRILAFGGGPHVCLGAHLARLEAGVALPALFTQYPDLRLTTDAAALPPVRSLFSNSAATLPIELSTSTASPQPGQIDRTK